MDNIFIINLQLFLKMKFNWESQIRKKNVTNNFKNELKFIFEISIFFLTNFAVGAQL